MNPISPKQLWVAFERLNKLAQQWQVTLDETLETTGSVLGFGLHHGSRVVIKISKQRGDEWRCGEVLSAFDGHGTVRVLKFEGGAVLLERLVPGERVVNLVLQGQDDKATETLAEVISRLAGRAAPGHCPTLLDWSRGFERYRISGDEQIPSNLVTEACDLYHQLIATQQHPMLLHGDLQHYNVLFDNKRGWVAIDPKGVVGELEYEVGAILRNPVELSDFFTSTSVVEHRLALLSDTLNLNYARALAWAFAQAVLSAIWDVEDGYKIHPNNGALRLAATLKSLTGGSTLAP